MMSSISEVKPSINQLTTENAKLKALIDKLTTRIDLISNITNMVKEAVQEEWIPEITQSVQEVVEEVKEENAKLKEENAKLKEKCGEWKDKFMILEESAKKHLGNGFNDYKQ